jgi:hypothetical protein
MATIFTAGNRGRVHRGVPWLLAVALLVVPATALGHELEHVLHQHDDPCGLHVAAEHLAMAITPGPAAAAGPRLALASPPSPPAPGSPARRPGGSRGPPVLP